jgi:hypothetical protein
MSISERRRQQNREAQAKRRATLKQQATKAETARQEQPPAIDVSRTSAVQTPAATPAITPNQFVRAGRIAGQLEMSFRSGMPIPAEEDARSWLDNHPIGASVALEVLSVSGLAPAFVRWRGAR